MTRKMILYGCTILTAVFMSAAVNAQEGQPVLKTDKDKVNYALGVNMIGNFKQQGVDIDLDRVIQGMKDAHSGKKLLMSDEEIKNAINEYYVKMRQMKAKPATKPTTTNK